MKDPWSVLGIPRDATEDQIKTAYRKLAMQWHPDRNQGDKAAEEKFKEISAAYEELRKPQPSREPGSGPEWHKHQANGRTWHEFRAGNGTFNFNFDDFFQDFDSRRRHRNDDLIANVAISLEDAFNGKEVELTLKGGPEGIRYVKLSVPAGVESGTRMKIAGAGDNRFAHLPAGDLIVTIYTTQHPLFTRVAQNLVLETTISAFDAILGGEVDVPTISGQTVRVTIPVGIQPGARLRVAGHGMPVVGLNQRGDMIVVVNVTIPTGLSTVQLAHIKEAKDLGVPGATKE